MRVRHPNNLIRLRRRGDGHRPIPAELPEQDDHLDERRWREAGGPDDRATYSCACGFVFEADVSASVACPHCGTGQAW